MLYDVVEVKVINHYTLYIRFENGEEGQVDISKVVPFEGVFSKLKDIEYFATVQLNKELGTITWDNGSDLAPSYLYSIIVDKAA